MHIQSFICVPGTCCSMRQYETARKAKFGSHFYTWPKPFDLEFNALSTWSHACTTILSHYSEKLYRFQNEHFMILLNTVCFLLFSSLFCMSPSPPSVYSSPLFVCLCVNTAHMHMIWCMSLHREHDSSVAMVTALSERYLLLSTIVTNALPRMLRAHQSVKNIARPHCAKSLLSIR